MFDKTSPYYIDFPGRIKAIQAEMAKEKIDLYLGSRLRTMSWTTDAFFPWRSFIVIPADGLPTAFTFVIDAARAADDSWLDEDHVMGFAPMGGQDQITQISDFIKDLLPHGGRIGVEAGMSNYLPEGYLTYYEYKAFEAALPDCTLVNAHPHRRPPADDQGRRHDQPLPRGVPHRGYRARGRARRPQKRRLEGHDRDGDRGPRGLRHAQGGQHV